MKKLIPLLCLFVVGCTFPYFNIYYNAKKYYHDAEKIALKDDGKPTPSAITNYNKAITKCSRILTDHPKSKWADDALFLLAKSLFYRANSYIQAEDKFRELVTFYPESSYVQDAYIFMARCEYEVGHKAQAYTLLQQFLVDHPESDEAPQVLDLLASYYLRDKEYGAANYYLQRILKDYTKSDQYESAFFMLGRSLYDNAEYAASDSVFQSLFSSRISRRAKLDGQYYLSLNRLMLRDYTAAQKIAKKLLRDEYQTPNLARYEIVRARALIGMGSAEQALDILRTVIKNNARSLSSAEAYYWIGEMYFSSLLDNPKAKENYDKVEGENNRSPFVPMAKDRSAIVQQIILFSRPQKDTPPTQLVDQQLKLAENYLDLLQMPDSALAIYDRIPLQRSYYELQRDSLGTVIDSILAIPDTVYVQRIDSLSTLKGDLTTRRDQARAAIDSTNIKAVAGLHQQLGDLTRRINALNEEKNPTKPKKQPDRSGLERNPKNPGMAPDSLRNRRNPRRTPGFPNERPDSLRANPDHPNFGKPFAPPDSLQRQAPPQTPPFPGTHGEEPSDTMAPPISTTPADSLQTDSETARADSLRLAIEKKRDLQLDSLNVASDTLRAQLGRLQALPPDPNLRLTDSLNTVLTTVTRNLEEQLQAQRNRYGLQGLQTQRKGCEATIRDYNETYIPLSRFVRIRLLLDAKKDTLSAKATYDELLRDQPDSRFAYAAGRLMAGESPELTTPAEIEAEARYENAESLIESTPLTAAAEFESLSVRSIPIADKALLALGWVRFFVLNDSLNAKACLDSVLARHPGSDYATFIATFYTDGHFLHFERLPYLVELEEAAARKTEQEAENLENPETPPDDKNSKAPDKNRKDPPPTRNTRPDRNGDRTPGKPQAGVPGASGK
jgi:TolA-binding protein